MVIEAANTNIVKSSLDSSTSRIFLVYIFFFFLQNKANNPGFVFPVQTAVAAPRVADQ